MFAWGREGGALGWSNGDGGGWALDGGHEKGMWDGKGYGVGGPQRLGRAAPSSILSHQAAPGGPAPALKAWSRDSSVQSF